MKKVIYALVLSILVSIGVSYVAYGDNPIVQTIYTSDPAVMVYEDTLYLYTGHDEDGWIDSI